MPSPKKKPAKKKLVVPPLNTSEFLLCHCILAGKTPEQAAEELGLSMVDVAAWLGRTHVKAYMAQFREQFMERMIASAVESVRRKKITYDTIIDELHNLALMPPERTRGSIDGQVTALKEMAAIMGLKFDPKDLHKRLETLTDAELAALETSGAPV